MLGKQEESQGGQLMEEGLNTILSDRRRLTIDRFNTLVEGEEQLSKFLSIEEIPRASAC